MMCALAIKGRDDKAGVLDLGPAAAAGPGQVRLTVEAASVNGIDAAIAALAGVPVAHPRAAVLCGAGCLKVG
jgi:NADPH:quinone reductase-like Zn-dependent oxidoreductase